MKPTVARLFREARQNTGASLAGLGGGDWSTAEVRATVDDYLAMLTAEIAGQRYSKAEHRRALSPKLNAVRTAAAIEFKHQNISAAMLDLGPPYIRGYKPRGNYQAALTTAIQRHGGRSAAAGVAARRHRRRHPTRRPAAGGEGPTASSL
jgi:hypothetical protein